MSSGIMLYSFNWDKFQELLQAPSTKLAQTLFDLIQEERKNDENLIKLSVEEIGQLFSQADWYSQKTRIEQEMMDEMVATFFNSEPAFELLSMDAIGGMAFETHELVSERHENRHSPRSDIPELLALGERPFRYASWVSTPAEFGGHSHNYSIHSPEQVRALFEESEDEQETVEDQDDGELHDDFMFGYLEPLEAAAERGEAIYAWNDT